MSKRIKRVSRKREQKAGKDIGGRAHIASGALWFEKGDASGEHYLIEDKFTESAYYSISLTILKKLEKEALSVGKLPVLRFGFEPKKGDFAVLRECDCEHLIDDSVLIIHEMSKKSSRYYLKILKTLYAESQSGLFMFKLILDGVGFYIFKWENFVDNQFKFVSVEEC